MSVFDADDAGLRRLAHEHLKVLAKLPADGCDLCADLTPSVAQFATEPEFAGIKFLRLDAAENPGARHLMNERAAPFFCQLLSGAASCGCDPCSTTPKVRVQLQRLRTLVPQTG